MRSSDTREAAADALASSTLLACLPTAAAADAAEGADADAAAPGPVLGEPILRAWLAALELMEDEVGSCRHCSPRHHTQLEHSRVGFNAFWQNVSVPTHFESSFLD